MELLEEDKELQGDLRYLLGAGRIRTCYSVYGKAVDQNEIEESRLFTDIENWEASSRKQSDEEGDTILDFLHKSGNESRQLLGALARNFSDHFVCGYDVWRIQGILPRETRDFWIKRFGRLLRRLPERISGAKLRTG